MDKSKSSHKALDPKGTKKRLGEGSKYSRTDVLTLKELFDKHDRDGNGRVTSGEILSAMERAKRVPDEAVSMFKVSLSTFKTVDINKDDVLTFNEYLRRVFPYANDREFKVMMAWAQPAAAPAEPIEPLFEPSQTQLREITRMFQLFDKDRNGVIDVKELIAMAATFGYDEESIEDLFQRTDKNMNGTMSFEEFIQLMKMSYI